MISANDVNKIANEAAARIKEEDTKLVQQWMDKINLEKRITNVAEAGLYTLDIDIKECPSFSIFKQIMVAAGYEVGCMVGSCNATISWQLLESYRTAFDSTIGRTWDSYTGTDMKVGGFTF